MPQLITCILIFFIGLLLYASVFDVYMGRLREKLEWLGFTLMSVGGLFFFIVLIWLILKTN